MSKAKIFQIYYDDQSKSQLDAGFIGLDNTSADTDGWYEFRPIFDYLKANTLEEDVWYGFLSPKFKSKTGCDSAYVYEFLDRVTSAAQLYRKEEDSVLVKMSWNIFAGRETISRAQAAAYDYRESAEKEKNVNNKTKESVRVAWNQYKKGLERLDLLESAVKTSQGVMRGRKRLRDAGKETALAVLDSEVEHFGLLANKVNASMDAKLGSYRLLSALGKLDIESLNLDQGRFEIPTQSIDKAVKELVGNELLVR